MFINGPFISPSGPSRVRTSRSAEEGTSARPSGRMVPIACRPSPPARAGVVLCAVLLAALPGTLLGEAPRTVERSVEAVTDHTAASELQGVVRSADDGVPLSAALIRVEGSDRHALSDASGRFQLSALPVGEYILQVERIGYRPASLEVSVGPGEPLTTVEVRLEPDPLVLPGLVVSITGELRSRWETASSVSRLGGEEIRSVNPSHPAELLNRVPGVWVSPTSTEGHMTAIRQPITTKPVYLFLEDGVPTRSPGFFNHNALYEVNVPQADRIEVIRGPGTSLYGSDAIGGVIDVGTRPTSTDPEIEATVEGNSLGFRRVLASASGTRGSDGLRFDLNLTEGDDWRDASGYDRQSATLRWDRALGSGMGLRTTATWSSVNQQDPSVISRDDLTGNPSVNYHPITFRSVDALRVASRFERRTAASALEVTPFIRWNTLDLMPSWMLNFDPVIYRTGHSSTGLMVRYHRDLGELGGPARITVGADMDRSPGSREEDRIVVTREGPFITAWERGERIYDYEAVFLGVSPYAQLSLNPVEPLHVTAGLRFDRVGFDYTSSLPALAEGPHRRPEATRIRYSNLGPSLGAALALRPEVNLFSSFRDSFRSPSEGQLFRQGAAESTVTLEPVRSRSLEGGIRGELSGTLGYELSFFRLDIRDDILSFIRPEDGLRESLNAGRTRHRGVEAGISAAFPGGIRADATLTRASHRYLEWRPRPDQDFGGNLMEQAPRDLASARFRTPLPGLPRGHLELEWVRMGEFWMDPANENRYEGHTLWNLRAEAPLAAGMSLQARVLNLMDEAYAERAGFNPFRGEELSPGKPRAVFVGLRYRWAQ
ncbi:MAG: TonB-dependent receptor [Gemmatimonadales bacterium]|nr:MAG: TonB-dependent receptor [Gemmatimonadales bacterium]